MFSSKLSTSRLPVILCGAIFFAIGALFTGVAAYLWLQDTREERALRAEGQAAQGTVVSKSIHADRSGGSTETTFRINYRFGAAQTDEVVDSADVNAATWEQLKQGGAVKVTYLPSSPSVHRIEGQDRGLLVNIIFGGVGIVFVLLGGLMLLWNIERAPHFALTSLDYFTRAPLLTFAVLWLIVTVPFLAGGAYLFALQRTIEAKFNTEAVKAIGMVLTKQVVRTRGHGQNSGTIYTSYRISFRYDASSGEIVGTVDLDENVWARLSERGPITVIFLADEPWEFRLAGAGTGWGNAFIVLAIGLGGTLIGLVVLVFGLKIARNAARPAKATALSSTPRVRATKPAPPRPSQTTTEDLTARAATAALAAIPGISVSGGGRPGWRLGAWTIPLIGIVFAVVGFVLVFSGIKELIDDRDYAAHGMTAQGRVIGKTIERAGQNNNENTKYILSYRFTTAKGETLDGRLVRSVEVWEAIKEGDTISVRYLPDRPEVNREANESAETDGLVMAGMGMVFAMVGSGIVIALSRRDLRRWRLRHKGTMVEGTVREIVPSSLRLNGVRQQQLRYSFRDASGHEHEGTSGPLAPDAVSRLRVGDKGSVYYDPNKPDDNIWGS
jgi:Protein of unknown function (DUF3592)